MAKAQRARELPKLIREEIARRGLTQYRIAQETDIKQPSLCRFLRGGSLRLETAAKLLDYLGFEIVQSNEIERAASQFAEGE